MEDKTSIFKAASDLYDQLSLLAISGVAGSFFRAILAPEKKVGRRIVQGIAGAMSAIFLGGIVGHVLNSMTGSGVYSFLAAGFLMGSGGEVAVKKIQDKILGKEDADKDQKP